MIYRFGIFSASIALFVLVLSAMHSSRAYAEEELISPNIKPRFMFLIEPKDAPLDSPFGIFFDKVHNELYVADSGSSRILIFDSEGTQLFSFGKKHGIAMPIDLVVKDDKLYVSQEGKSYVEVFSYLGVSLKRMTPGAEAFNPGLMDLDREGNIYVANKANGKCVIFDKDDKYVKTIGDDASSMGGVSKGVSSLFIMNPISGFFGRHSINEYDMDGKLLRSFEGIQDKAGTLGLPSTLKEDPEGNLWVVDSLRGIVIFDKKSKKIASFGRTGPKREILFFPTDIDFNPNGMIYILDKEAKRVAVFR
jgi:DNA-binding beta-propeller fold protein YncE